MKCRKCDRDIVEQAKFCNYCGAQSAVGCTGCGVLNPSDALYCRDCGRNLTAPRVDSRESARYESRQPRDAGARCPRCGTGNEPASTYCYQCGLPLEEEMQADLETESVLGQYADLYRSPRRRANWTIALLIVTCIIHFVYGTVTLAYTFGYFSLYEFGDVMSGLGFWAPIPTGVAFFTWIYRAAQNLPTLGVPDRRFSPGWAIGYWFIPIISLFRPYQVMGEISRGSSPAISRSSTDGRVTALLPWWWACWLASTVGGVVATAGEFVPEWWVGWEAWLVLWFFSISGTALLSTSPQSLLANALTICAGVLAILVVRRITNHQDKKHLRIMTN